VLEFIFELFSLVLGLINLCVFVKNIWEKGELRRNERLDLGSIYAKDISFFSSANSCLLASLVRQYYESKIKRSENE